VRPQNVYKHKHHARTTSTDDAPSGVLDSLSDTLLNAFAKLKKPDERFVVIRQHLDSFEEGLSSLERLAGRSRTRMSDLSGDYEDLAVSVQGLGYLESGITEPLMRFERALVDFGSGVKDHSASASEGFLEHVHSLLAYSHAFKGVLKLRDQKQLDFEELSAYLSNVATERDRLAGGYGYGMGLGSYFKEKVESLRGGETDMSRAARLHRLDAKIKEVRRRRSSWTRPSRAIADVLVFAVDKDADAPLLVAQLQDAVLHAQETSSAFNDEVMAEHATFRASKRHEMKLLLGAFADGQIRMHKQSIASWDRCVALSLSLSLSLSSGSSGSSGRSSLSSCTSADSPSRLASLAGRSLLCSASTSSRDRSSCLSPSLSTHCVTSSDLCLDYTQRRRREEAARRASRHARSVAAPCLK